MELLTATPTLPVQDDTLWLTGIDCESLHRATLQSRQLAALQRALFTEPPKTTKKRPTAPTTPTLQDPDYGDEPYTAEQSAALDASELARLAAPSIHTPANVDSAHLVEYQPIYTDTSLIDTPASSLSSAEIYYGGQSIKSILKSHAVPPFYDLADGSLMHAQLERLYEEGKKDDLPDETGRSARVRVKEASRWVEDRERAFVSFFH